MQRLFFTPNKTQRSLAPCEFPRWVELQMLVNVKNSLANGRREWKRTGWTNDPFFSYLVFSICNFCSNLARPICYPSRCSWIFVPGNNAPHKPLWEVLLGMTISKWLKIAQISCFIQGRSFWRLYFYEIMPIGKFVRVLSATHLVMSDILSRSVLRFMTLSLFSPSFPHWWQKLDVFGGNWKVKDS